MAVKIQEGFALFSKRMDAKAFIEGEDESLDNMESQKMVETNKERDERKRKLLFDNLDLIMRHRDEIMKTPRYAKIDVHYALRGGGAYIGPIAMQRRFSAAGVPVTVGITLGSLLGIWGAATYKVNCGCGGRNSWNSEQALWRLCSPSAKCARQRDGGGFAGFYFGDFWQGE